MLKITFYEVIYDISYTMNENNKSFEELKKIYIDINENEEWAVSQCYPMNTDDFIHIGVKINNENEKSYELSQHHYVEKINETEKIECEYYSFLIEKGQIAYHFDTIEDFDINKLKIETYDLIINNKIKLDVINQITYDGKSCKDMEMETRGGNFYFYDKDGNEIE